MKLFESVYQHNRVYKQRYFDTDLGRSVFETINEPGEYFVQSNVGGYKYLLDEHIKLKKMIGFPFKSQVKTYGTIDAGYKCIRDKYWKEKDSAYNMNPRIWYIDIETTAESKIDVINTPQELVLIQIWDSIEKTMIVLGSQPWHYQNKFKLDYKVKYIEAKNEAHLFETYFHILQQLCPLVILGWNTEGFDYPFMYNRAKKLGLDTNKFAIDGESSLKETIMGNGMTIHKLKAGGVFYMDMLDLYKKYAFKGQPSYALNHVANDELGVGKVDHNEYTTFDGFRTGKGYVFPDEVPTDEYDLMMYNAQVAKDDELIRKLAWGKFVYYGCEDTKRVHEIDEKIQASVIALAVSSKMGIQFNDVLGTVKPWSQYLADTLYTNNVIMPDVDVDHEEQNHIKGGWVMDPVRGKHKWIVSFDFASLYPSIMRAYNMSPETIIARKDYTPDMIWIAEQLKNTQTGDEQDEDVFISLGHDILKQIEEKAQKANVCVGANGVFFKKDKQGVIPKLLEMLYNERKEFKKDMSKYKNQVHELDAKNEDSAEAKLKAAQYHIKQMTNKILLNSLYGAIGNKYFPIFNQDMARAVTMGGRVANKYVGQKMNELYENKYGHKNLMVAGDTDSVVGSSVVQLKDNRATIESMYEDISGDIETRGNNNYIKHVTEDVYAASVSSDGKLEYNKVNYIMKHKVKKKMYRISALGKHVTVTEDHSVIVKRDGKLQSTKPAELKSTDKIITL